MPCGTEIVNAIDRVYVLMDATLNGVTRDTTGQGTEINPYIYSPPLAQGKEADDFVPPSLRSDTNATRALLDNLVTGATNPLVNDARNIRTQLEEIIARLEPQNNLDAEQLAELAKIVALLA